MRQNEQALIAQLDQEIADLFDKPLDEETLRLMAQREHLRNWRERHREQDRQAARERMRRRQGYYERRAGQEAA